nr:MAG TPA: tail tube protein [Caudoviricetes sp.]
MTALTWDKTGEHVYETGVSNGVLYKYDKAGKTYKAGVAWNGLTTVTMSPEGAESNAVYADNIKYLDLISAEEMKFTIEAVTYPDEFAECDGTAAIAEGVYIGQQERAKFAFCYRNKIGNDQDSEAGYKLHIVYNATAAPSERAYATVSDSPEAITFSWECSTTPVPVANRKPTAELIIDSTKVAPEKLKKIEAKLYGDNSGQPTLLTPDEVLALLA